MDREKNKAVVSLDVSMGTKNIGSVQELLAFLDVNGSAVLHYLHDLIPDRIKAGNKTKESNPKQAMGDGKVSMHTIPVKPLLELANAFTEGGRKYGTHNYRDVGVRISTYYNAAMRHLVALWEGEDIDPDSGVPHAIKVMACMAVLRDSQLMGNCTDDRPIQYPDGINMAKFNKIAKELLTLYPNCVEPFTHLTHGAPLPHKCKCGTTGRFNNPPNCSEHDGSKAKIPGPTDTYEKRRRMGQVHKCNCGTEGCAPAGTFKDTGQDDDPSGVPFNTPLTEPADQKIGKIPKFWALAMDTPVEIMLEKRDAGLTRQRCQAANMRGKYRGPYATGSNMHVIKVGPETVNLYEGQFKKVEKFQAPEVGKSVTIHLRDGVSEQSLGHRCNAAGNEGVYVGIHETMDYFHVIKISDGTVYLYENEFKEILV